MPFNYATQAPTFQIANQQLIDSASKTPFSIAGNAMNQLNDDIQNRVFADKAQKANSLDELRGLYNPQTKESQAVLANQSSLLNQLGQEQNRADLLDLQKDKFGLQQKQFDLTNATTQQALADEKIKSDIKKTALAKLGVNVFPDSPKLMDNGKSTQEKLSPLERIQAERNAYGNSPTLDLLQEKDKLKALLNKPVGRKDLTQQIDYAHNKKLEAIKLGDQAAIDYYTKLETRLFEGQSEVTDIGSQALTKKILTDGYSFDTYNKNNAITTESAVKADKNIYTTNLKKAESNYKIQSNFTKQLVDVNNNFNKNVGSGNFKSGAWDSVVQWLDTRTAENFTIKDMDKVLTQVGLNTQLGRVLAERLKFYSGTSAAESEFKRTKELMIGLNSQDEKTRQKALNTFTEAEVNGLKYSGELLGGSGLGQTAKSKYDYATKDYNKDTKPIKTKSEDLSKSPIGTRIRQDHKVYQFDGKDWKEI